MIMTIDGSAASLTEEDIARAERRIGRPIPAAYRAFLISHNGGRPSFGVFLIQDKDDGPGDRSRINWFFGISTGRDYNDLELMLEDYRDRIPSNFLPVADDPFGNLVCLLTEGEQAGAVYFWDHERETERGEGLAYGNMRLIARSFDEFLNGLRRDDSR